MNIVAYPTLDFHVFRPNALIAPALEGCGRATQDFGCAFRGNELGKLLILFVHGRKPPLEFEMERNPKKGNG